MWSFQNIGRFHEATQTWSKAGEMNIGRTYHRAIYDGSSFLAVGTSGNKKTDKCVLEGEKMTCTLLDASVEWFWQYPALFLVDPAEYSC